MRKLTVLLLLGLILLSSSACAGSMVPEEVLHDAVMTLCWEDDGGECWTEGHIVLGEASKGSTHEVYAYVRIDDYGFMDGVFTDTGGGASMPVTLVFDRADSGFVLQKIIEPEDGERYRASIERMFPQYCVRAMDHGAVDDAELKRQQHEQAQAYLDSIGRTEKIQDWRERGLQLADMLVYAANEVICFSPPYPLWVTNVERLEEGVRYRYERVWYPAENAQSVQESSGVPGTQVLTKIRCSDGDLMEKITICADLHELTVTMEDAGGSRTYTMMYDGAMYYRPVITEEGECAVRYEMFDLRCAELPEK